MSQIDAIIKLPSFLLKFSVAKIKAGNVENMFIKVPWGW